jgi:hypothetical protein
MEFLAGGRIRGTNTERTGLSVTNALSASGISTTSLKAYYTFNEASGNIINQASSIGSSDMIASSDLTTSGITYGETGIVGDSVSFDGTGNYVRASSTSLSDYSFMSQTGALWTFITWYRLNNFTNEQSVFSTTVVTGGESGVLIRVGTDKYWDVYAGSHGGDQIQFSNSIITPNDTDWHMLMVSYSDSTGVMSVSIDDGTVVTSTGHNLTNTNTPNHRHDTGSQLYNLNGNVDEMSIWNRVLTSSEISSLYTQSPNIEDGSIFYETDTNKSYVLYNGSWTEV